MSNSILITGGAGFIGLHLARKLVSNGYKVDLVDNLTRGIRDEDLETLLSHTSVSFTQLDLTDQKSTLVLGSGYHAIYHLAGIVGVKHVLNRPYEVMDTNIRMLQNVITLAKRQSSLNRLLFASTSEVYAGTLEKYGLEIPTVEESNIVVSSLNRPRTSYMLSKIVGEVMCQHCGVPFTIFRPHNIYGPRMGMAHVIPELLRKVWDIQSPQPLEVYSVDHSRSFCYVDDLVVGLIRLMRTEDHCTGPVNLGNPDEFQIKELAERVLALVGSRSKIIYKELPQDDPQQRRPDITLAKAQLNWQPSIALDEGLRRTVEYFRALLAQGDPKAG